jgi:hypothetical protein
VRLILLTGVLFLSACELKEFNLRQKISPSEIPAGIFYEVDTGYRCQPYVPNAGYIYGIRGELRVFGGVVFIDGCSDALEALSLEEKKNIQVLQQGDILRFRGRNFIRFARKQSAISESVFEIIYPGYTCETNTHPSSVISSYVDKVGFFESEMYLTGDQCNDAHELRSEFEFYLSYDEEFLRERHGIYKRNLLMSVGF